MYLKTNYKNFRSKKYNNKSTFYNGRNYHSKLEAKVAQELDFRKLSGEVIEWTPQKKIEFNLVETENGFILTDETKLILKNSNKKFIHLFNYFLDFEVSKKDGSIELIEVKGLELSPGMMKFKMLEALYSNRPEYQIIMVKS